MQLYIYDKNLSLVSIVDEWISVIWKSVFNGDVGGIDIELPATADNIKVFQKDYLVERSDKFDLVPTAKTDGGKSMTQCRDVMVIESTQKVTDSGGQHKLIVGGSHITTFLKRRVLLTPFTTTLNEPMGFFGKISAKMLVNTFNNYTIAHYDYRRGMPIEALWQDYGQVGVRRAKSLGYLGDAFPDNGRFLLEGVPTYGLDIVSVYWVFDSGSEPPPVRCPIYVYYWSPGYGHNIVKTTDNKYLLYLGYDCHRPSTPSQVVTLSYYLWGDKPPDVIYADIVDAPFAFTDMMTGYVLKYSETIKHEYIYLTNVAGFESEYVLEEKDYTNQLMIVGPDPQHSDEQHIGIVYSPYDPAAPKGTQGYILDVMDGSSNPVYQKTQSFERRSWFETLDSIMTKADAGLMLYPSAIPFNMNSPLLFAVYAGEERNIEFSLANENLISAQETSDNADYSNVAYIVGTYPSNPNDEDPDEIDLVTYTPQDIAEDMFRREILIESSLKYKDDDTGLIFSLNTFREKLVAEGNQQLNKDNIVTNDFDCEVVANSELYRLNQDYFLGDIIRVRDAFGSVYRVRIIETSESWTDDKYNVSLTLRLISIIDEPFNCLLTQNSESLLTEDEEYILTEQGA